MTLDDKLLDVAGAPVKNEKELVREILFNIQHFTKHHNPEYFMFHYIPGKNYVFTYINKEGWKDE
jgi:hypothetical protein